MSKRYSPYAKYKLYKIWLEGYKKKGGRVEKESWYNRRTFHGDDDWVVVEKGKKCYITPDYGSNSRIYIILSGAELKISNDGVGHNKYFNMNDFSTNESYVYEYNEPDKDREKRFYKKWQNDAIYSKDIDTEELIALAIIVGGFDTNDNFNDVDTSDFNIDDSDFDTSDYDSYDSGGFDFD